MSSKDVGLEPLIHSQAKPPASAASPPWFSLESFRHFLKHSLRWKGIEPRSKLPFGSARVSRLEHTRETLKQAMNQMDNYDSVAKTMP